MRVLIAVSCLLAVASAGYQHGYHVPVIGPHGVPVDEPAVAAAKAHHFAAYAEAAARGGAGHYDDGQYDNGAYDNGVYNDGHLTAKWQGPLHYPVIGPHGVPVDQPANQEARAHHAAAHAEAAARGGHGGYVASYGGQYAGGQVGHVAHGAVPHDTPEVAAAKAAHFAAHAEVSSRGHYAPLVHYRKRRGIYGYAGHYAGPQHIPVIGPHGVPLDEPAVAIAKSHHAAAHAEAAARAGAGHYDDGAGHYDDGAYDDGSYNGGHDGAYAGHYGYAGPIHVPVIGPHGVPVDEPAVQAARAHHAAAHAAAGGHLGHSVGLYAGPVGYAGHYGHAGAIHVPVIGPHGVPQDEPAVVAARAHHAAAHAEAAAHSGGYHQW